MRSLLATFGVVVFGITVVSAGEGLNRWSSMSSPGFTRCEAQTECPFEQPCDLEFLELGASCGALCQDEQTPGTPCVASSFAEIGWGINGAAGHFPCPGDTFPGTDATVSGRRSSDGEFEITAFVKTTGVFPKIVEISLFRFAGDPFVFEGLDLTSVSELVDLGLIDQDDVLFVTEIDGDGQLSETVDISGIPDDGLILFAAGDGPLRTDHGCPVPAMTPWGAAALFGALLLLGTSMRRFFADDLA